MRLLWSAASPWCNSGYGKPLRNLIPLLHEAGHQSAIAPYSGYGGAASGVMVGGAPVKLYPPFKDAYFNDCIEMHAQDWQANVVISLQDVWVLQDWAERDFTWLPWLPIDTNRITEPVAKALDGCAMPLSMSKHGQGLLVEAGWLGAKHIPFGVDLEMYRPRSKDVTRMECGLPPGKFIAGMVAANSSYPSRKSFPEVLMAWRRWLDAGGDGLLYIHSRLQPKYSQRRGLFFPTLLDSLGLKWATMNNDDTADAQVLFPDAYRYWSGGHDDEELASIMNSFDVLLSPSQAEGFGIPILEAQACGVPVVTLNTTAMPEITFSGKCLEPLQQVWEIQGGWRGLVGVDSLVGAIEWSADMLMTKTGGQHYREHARAGAEDYSWQQTVDDYWLPILDEVMIK